MTKREKIKGVLCTRGGEKRIRRRNKREKERKIEIVKCVGTRNGQIERVRCRQKDINRENEDVNSDTQKRGKKIESAEARN